MLSQSAITATFLREPSTPILPPRPDVAPRHPRQWGNAGLRESATRPHRSAHTPDSTLVHRLMEQRPVASALFLAGLARERGTPHANEALLQQTAAHARLIAQVDERLTLQGEPGLRALQRLVHGRAPGRSVAQVFEQFMSHRTRRDLDRSTCRADARAAATQAGAVAASAGRSGNGAERATLTRMRLGSPLHWLTGGLLLAAQGRPGDAQPDACSATAYAAVPTGSGAAPAPRAMLVLGSAGLATTALAGVTLWRIHAGQAQDRDAVQVESMAAALRAVHYLDQRTGGDKERLLDSLVWCSAAGHPDRIPGDVLEPRKLAQLADMIGDGDAVGAWLGALLELDPGCSASPSAGPAARLRLVRQASHVSAPATGAGSALLQHCQQVTPGQQPLATLESACAAVTRADRVAALADNQISACASCVQRIRAGVMAIETVLGDNRQALQSTGSLASEINRLQILSIDRLLARTRALSAQLTDALVRANQRIIDRIG